MLKILENATYFVPILPENQHFSLKRQGPHAGNKVIDKARINDTWGTLYTWKINGIYIGLKIELQQIL